MLKKIVSGIILTLLILGILALESDIQPVAATTIECRHFRLLAVEGQFDSCNMMSAQFLIKSLLEYQNWNNSTAGYVSYIHLLSRYSYEDVDDEVKPYWRGYSTKGYVQSEIENFLAQAAPGDIVIFYYCGHGDGDRLILDSPICGDELVNWLNLGGLPQAYVTVILDTCFSGSWIRDGEGGLLGPNRTVLAACLSIQFAWGFCESWSWFTYIGIIKGFSLANDTNNDGWVSAAEAFTYAKPATESYANEAQNPVSYYGQLEGDIPLTQRDVTKPFPIWDLAITSVNIDREYLYRGFPLSINVTLKNQGEKAGAFDVKVYANTILIDVQKMSLNPNKNMTLVLVWDTTAIPVGMYTISATGTIWPGETSIEDNVFIDGTVDIRMFSAGIINIDSDTLNLRSKGRWITTHIELPEDYNVNDINVSSILLNGTVPIDIHAPLEIGDYDDDEIPDLTVEFNRTEVVSFIHEKGLRYGNVTLTLKGKFYNGKFYNNTLFEGSDIIKVSFLPGDVNCDEKVDIYDVIQACLGYGSKEENPNWNSNANFAPSWGIIDIYDLVTIASHYWEEWEPS